MEGFKSKDFSFFHRSENEYNNPHLIEFYIEAYSSWLFQYTIGTAFGKFTDEIIDYCKDNKSDIEEILLL